MHNGRIDYTILFNGKVFISSYWCLCVSINMTSWWKVIEIRNQLADAIAIAVLIASNQSTDIEW